MTVTLQVWRVPARSVPQALWRMAVDPRRLRASPGVRFGKLLGTASGRRFGVRDAELTRYAALAVWDDSADPGACESTPVARAWARIAVAYGRFDLRPLRSRGRWSGQQPFAGEQGGAREPDGLVLALTRARLRPAKAVTFWRAVPPVATAVHTAPGLLATFGIGEAPVGWQGTVSVWRGAADLIEFAYRHPQHRTAITRTEAQRWYAEELFARFAVLDVIGDRAVLGWTDERTMQG